MKSIWVAILLFFHDFFQDSYIVLKTIAIAIAGGFIDYVLLNKQNGETFSFKKASLHCFIAGFAGFLAQKLCMGFDVNQNLTGFLIGISGFAGTRMLGFFEKLSQTIFEKISELQVEVKFGKKEKEEKEDKENE